MRISAAVRQIRVCSALGRTSATLVAFLVAFAAVPAQAQSPLESVVAIRATIPADARTADSLGTEREGSGVVIGPDGLVLTIGYLILEAISTEITLQDQRVVPAEVVAYDYETGFGLLRPLADTGLPAIELGESAGLQQDNPVLVASFAAADTETPAATAAHVVSRREFAGYWEYLLPDAIFTAPPHLSFGGAALIGQDGRLLGIGSLFVSDAASTGVRMAGNMFVPIDALKPILDDLRAHGQSRSPRRPWLGLYTGEVRGHLFVHRVAPGGPAAAAGLRANDVILEVDGGPVAGMADFYKRVWALGGPGVEVPITVLSGGRVQDMAIIAGDRYDYLKLDPSF
ncbi:MAG TPA: S1C family serine protease [Kiloniellales bacterium]